MEARTPPDGFVRDLRAYDPDLRLRWGRHSTRWLIERRLGGQSPTWLKERPSPSQSERGRDLWEGWVAGYVHVLSVANESLHWNLVLPALREADLQVKGGVEAINRALDAEEDAIEAQSERGVKNWTAAASSEAYDRLAWLSGRRQAVTDIESTPPADQIEVHEGFTVRIRRKVTPDAP